MPKIRFVNMHMNRSSDINDNKSREDDKAWMESFNVMYIPEANYKYKDLELTMDDDYDYLLVIDCIYRHFDQCGRKINYFDESKAIVMQAEPEHLRNRFDRRLYDDSNYDNRFVKVYKMNCLWGWLGYNINQLNSLTFNKTKNLSTIISTNQGIDGHTRRLLFLRDYLSTIECDHFGDERGLTGAFTQDQRFSKNYKGYLTCKKDGLIDYKYHFNGENCKENDYFSEKFTDSLLSGCLTFYDGCLNMDQYFDPRAFIPVNLSDPENALYTIKRSMRLNEYEQRLEYIMQERQKVINELNIIEMCYKAIHGIKNYWEK